ncbi:ubiquitin domain-containing protein DSK2a-like isoform X1 [Bidens hawaiensis]|uniref:ubiquitin domain-containing protein DSK2a-like isoform X1 n=1 Tax=Bidens hawaiensis TaxID=980011 RepID=UPI00404B37EB
MGGGSGDESNGADSVKINVRCSNGNKFFVQASLESSVESFKSVLEQNCDIPAAQQRLIYKGRILKDDQTLKSYGMEAEHTVHLVRSFVPATATPAGGAPAAATTTPPTAGQTGSVGGGTTGGPGVGGLFPGLGLGGMGGNGGGMFGGGLPDLEQMQQQLTQNPNMLLEIMDLPLFQNLLNNPEIMRNMMMNNPQMRDLIDRNPELGHMLNDPAILRQTMEAARNPELMREMMRNTDRAMSNIESSPEGFNMLRRMYENVQEPFLNATTMGGGGGDATNDLNSNPFAALLGGGQEGQPRGQVANPTTTGADTTTGSPAPNTNPLPNPWAAGGGGANQTNAAATNTGGAGRPPPPVGGLGGLGLPGLEGLLGGMTPDPNSMSQLMQNPAISQMMQSLLSNPQYMNQILGLNPQMRSMLDANPQLREMMQNPDFIRQLTSPETMQQMMTLQQSLFSGLGQQPTRDAGQNGGGTAGAPNNPNPNMNMEMLMNMFGNLGAGGFTAPTNSNVPPEELYATQLAQLQEMGFFDTRENLQALAATRGNVHAAVERLLGNLGP